MIHPYLWIAVVGGFVAFLTGAGVGMNDLSNAFGTTYGAKVLTLTQIIILASICEFGGAVALGGAVTSTISGGIANPADFANDPYVFMYGMLCACGASFLWLAVATWLTLPVSSTHSICGGVIGFALVYGGGGSVTWAKPQSEFPFVSGVVPIIASWFISPLLTGAVAAFVYGVVRYFVLRPANSVVRAIYTLPIIVAIAFFLESFFVLYKGAKNRLHWEVDKAAWVGACIGVGAGAVSCAFIPLLKRRVARMEAKAAAAATAPDYLSNANGEQNVGGENVDAPAPQNHENQCHQSMTVAAEEPVELTGEVAGKNSKRGVAEESVEREEVVVAPPHPLTTAVATPSPAHAKNNNDDDDGASRTAVVVVTVEEDAQTGKKSGAEKNAVSTEEASKKLKQPHPVSGAVVRDEEEEAERERGLFSFFSRSSSNSSVGNEGQPISNDARAAEANHNDGAEPTSANFRGVTVTLYNSNAEYVYRYLQIFTAICASFAHGASDVSNAVGPFAAIYHIYQTGEVSSKSETPIWILCLGGAGLVVGLSTFGVRLMRLLGEKITVITPSRGFSAELSAALVVSFASGYGIPVSSTHCITGAVVAISMVDVGFMRVRWMMVLKMYAGWVFTLVVTAVVSAAFFAQGVHAPTKS